MLDFAKTTRDQILDTLPETQHEKLSERYAFIDSRQVMDNMEDLGLYPHSFRFPKARTKSGAFGLHEIDFRRKENLGKPAQAETERVLFLNSYDGSRRAQVITGVFRLVCLNGLITGETWANEKFLHVGDYEDELVKQIRSIAGDSVKLMDTIERMKTVKLEDDAAMEMARKGIAIRDPKTKDKYALDPHTVLTPRRREDVKKDLWTRWNVLQENLLKGGLPSVDGNGNMRVTREIGQIGKSNAINRGLWDLLEETAELVA